MSEPFNEHGRDVAHIASSTPYIIVFQYADELVISFSSVDHLQATDDAGSNNNFVSCDHPFAEYTYVQWIPVASLCCRCQPAHPLTTICAGNESVEGWVLGRRPMRSIDAEIT